MQRIEIARIAATVQGVNADNFFKFCESLEGWAKNSGQTEEVKPEIDWSRPQLVRQVENGRIIKTNGKHSEYLFSGEVIEQGSGCFENGYADGDWGKSLYVYHGEIPNQPQLSKRLQEIIDHCKKYAESHTIVIKNSAGERMELTSNSTAEDFNGISPSLCLDETWEIEIAYKLDEFNQRVYSVRDGKVVSGLTFIEAIKQMKPGDSIRRENARTWVLTMNDNGTLTDSYAGTPIHYVHYLSADWQIIRKNEHKNHQKEQQAIA